jgi:hypothetical protein
MSDNQEVSPNVRVIMQEILYQLAALYDSNELGKNGIHYGAVIGNRGFTVKFERDTTLDASEPLQGAKREDLERAV